MGKPARDRRVGLTGAEVLQVEVANRHENLVTYEKRLSNTTDFIRLSTRDIDPNIQPAQTKRLLKRLAKTLTCGRIIAFNEGGVGQRTKYCDQSKLCECCNHLRAHQRAESVRLNRTLKRQPKVSHLEFTLPAPRDEKAELEYLQFANELKDELVDALGKAKIGKHEDFEIQDYVLGIHANAGPQGLLKPHLHLMIVETANSKTRDLIEDLRQYWMERTRKPSRPRQHGKIERLRLSCIVKEEFVGWPLTRARKPRKNTIQEARVHNLAAYIMRPGEKNDTPASKYRRRKLFKAAGIKFTYSRPRWDENRPKLPTKSSFHPVRLKKDFLVVFPIDGDREERYPTEDYSIARKMIAKQAADFIRNNLPPNLKHLMDHGTN